MKIHSISLWQVINVVNGGFETGDMTGWQLLKVKLMTSVIDAEYTKRKDCLSVMVTITLMVGQQLAMNQQDMSYVQIHLFYQEQVGLHS